MTKDSWRRRKKKTMMNSNPKILKHGVVLSFRSKDTRDNFVTHLCGCLRRKRIKTYLYDELPSEEREIHEESLKAIQVSRVSVIVFSENFGDSEMVFRWSRRQLSWNAERGLVRLWYLSFTMLILSTLNIKQIW